MKKLFLLVFLGFFIQNAYSQCADTTNIYKFTFNGKNYEVVKELKSWTVAAACAVERGGYLVQIGNLAEQNAVYSAITVGAGVSSTYVSIGNGGGIAYVWMGATDQNTEGTWLWDGNNDNSGANFWNGQGANGMNNGAAVAGSYINWGGSSNGNPMEPDNYNGAQSHGAIALAGWPAGSTMLGIASEWNDIIGSSQLYYVIEYDSTTTSINTPEDVEYKIYPNPTNRILNIEGADIERVEIIDQSGRSITYTDSFVIDLVDYAKGTYFVKIISTDKIITKIIILK
ncbi:MAG: hypothetical protein DRI84_07515 [Bacteroidetes bacterium]|nr:MAG: hypothetical protein DRI84_07515 [Bacteroidota bacterium]